MPTTYVSRISQWIEKRFNAKGGNVITDIDPTAIVQAQFPSGVEDHYLQGWNTYHASFAVTAVAAQFSRVLIRNPAGSNAILVIESFFIDSTGANDYSIVNGQGNLTNLQAPGTLLRRVDSRSGFGDSVAQNSFDNNATQFPGAANVKMFRQQGEVIFTLNQEIPILPNDGLMVAGDAVNTSLTLNFRYRERALETSELT